MQLYAFMRWAKQIYFLLPETALRLRDDAESYTPV